MKKPRTHLVLGEKYDRMIDDLVAEGRLENRSYCQTDLFRDMIAAKHAELKERAVKNEPSMIRAKISIPIEWTQSI